MNQFEKYSSRLAGALLIIGPGLIVCAALLAAAGIGTTTGRWYENRLEGILMATGFSLQWIGLVELCRRIGASKPILGVLTMVTTVLGVAGAIFPSAVRVLAAVELEQGITLEQLDRVHGPSDGGTDPLLIVIPFILCFFLSYLLLAFGIWRAQVGPRFTPILLAAGVVLFIMGQSSFEVVMPAYIAGVSAWFLALAPLGARLLREGVSVERLSAETRSAG